MFRRFPIALVALLLMCSTLLAADKTIKATLVKVDVKKRTLSVTVNDATNKATDEKKVYKVDAKTKFIGPKGGISDAGIKDDRLKPGAKLELVIAGNNKNVREVHLPDRKDLDK